MLRAVIQRAKLPHAARLVKSFDQSMLTSTQLRQSIVLPRQLVRSFAGGNDNIKGSAGASQGGVIGTSTTIGQVSTADSAQVQAASFGSASTRNEKVYKSAEGEEKSMSQCGKIGTDESESSKKCQNVATSTLKEGTGTAGSASQVSPAGKLADDAVKQLQEVAANLPSRAQVEKFTFRVLAFIYDIVYLTGTWAIRFVNEKILQNDSVKFYWKRFHEKMDEAKKD